jgi:regulator of nonsense transcripts 2
VQHKERSVIEQFIRHLLCDVLTRKTVDKVLRLLRRLHWNDPEIHRVLFKMFSRPWKVAYGSITLLAMLTYDLQRYHSEFGVTVVDQVLENIRRGMELNIYRDNQKRVATVKYLGELYIYRMINSRVVFDTFWSLTTFGHRELYHQPLRTVAVVLTSHGTDEGRPLPGVVCPIDSPDDFFRIRLVCTLLDACGMCFDRGSHKRKLNQFLTFFQVGTDRRICSFLLISPQLYILTKGDLPMDVDFMISETIEVQSLHQWESNDVYAPI